MSEKLLILMMTCTLLLAPKSHSATIDVGKKFREFIGKFLPEDMKLDWKDGKVNFSLGGVSFKGTGLCLTQKKSQNKVCFDSAEIQLKLSKFKVDPSQSFLRLSKGNIAWKISDSHSNSDTQASSVETKGSQKLYEALIDSFIGIRKMRALRIDVSIPQSKITMADSAITVNDLLITSDNNKAQIKVQQVMDSKSQTIASGTEVNADMNGGKLSLTLKSRLQSPSITPTLINGRLEPVDPKSKRPIQLTLKATSTLVRGGTPLTLPCQIQIAQSGEQATCQINTNLARTLNMKKITDLDVIGQFSCVRKNCKATLRVPEILSANIQLPIAPKETWQKGSLFVNISHLKSFATVAEKLDAGLPVPYRLADGSATVKADISHRQFSEWKVPLEITTDIQSSGQKVAISLNTKIETTTSSAKIKGQVDISDLIVTLPRYSLGSFPALSNDPRIVKKFDDDKESTESGFKVDYNIAIHTKRNGAIQIHSHRLKNPLQLSCKIEMTTEKPLSGWIAIEETELEVLKRRALVRRLQVNLKKEFADSELDGLIKIQQGIYDISVIISGIASDPVVKLQSLPIMSEGEIVSVLLYGHKSSELDGQEGQVADAKSKIANRSLGLLSMYVFAGTPIDSILYDAESRSVTAKMSLGENKLSVTEQNSSIKSVGVERRIYKNLFLRSKREFGDDTATTTTIEWENRY